MTRHELRAVLLCPSLLVLAAGCVPNAREHEVRVDFADLPAPVRSTIDARRGDATLGDIDLSSSDDGDVYDVELVRDGRVEELEIAPDGTVLATEIETPDDLDEQGDTDDDDDDDDEDDDDEDDDDEDDEDEKD